MPLGIAVFLVWLVLLLRFPRVMLPFSGVLVGLLPILAAAVGIRQWYTGNLAAQLQTSVRYQPESCDFGKPLRVTIDNQGSRSASQISWQLQATQPGFNTNLLDVSVSDATYQSTQALPPGEQWSGCYAVPRLRSGYRAPDLEYRIERLRADFQH